MVLNDISVVLHLTQLHMYNELYYILLKIILIVSIILMCLILVMVLQNSPKYFFNKKGKFVIFVHKL